LLEVLIALTICAVTAIMLYHQVNASVITSERIEEKSIALLVAKNYYADKMVERTLLAPGVETQEVELADREWRVKSTISETEYEDLRQVDVVIYRDSDEEYAVLSMSRLLWGY